MKKLLIMLASIFILLGCSKQEEVKVYKCSNYFGKSIEVEYQGNRILKLNGSIEQAKVEQERIEKYYLNDINKYLDYAKSLCND